MSLFFQALPTAIVGETKSQEQPFLLGQKGVAKADEKEKMMTRKLIDISIALESDDVSDAALTRPTITYIDHQESVPELLQFFPGLTRDELPEGAGWAIERVTLTTHSGTHLDAPYHYHPTMDKGKPAITIDQVPLEWCFQPGVKLDFRHFPDG